MMYTSESIGMICKLRRNPDLSDDCYERVLQALHVTLADIIRGVKEVWNKPLLGLAKILLKWSQEVPCIIKEFLFLHTRPEFL